MAAKKPAFDIISVGDATQDVFLMLHEASVHCDIKKDACLLCLSYADKVPVEGVHRSIGGNAANNAVGSARLGLKTAFASIVGGDETGEAVLRALKREGVARDHVRVDKGRATNYSTVLNFKGERTILVYHVERAYRLPKLRPSKWIYLTSMGKGHEKLLADLLAHVRSSGTRLAFNPGTHQLKRGLEKLRPVIEACDVLFVNKEEAKRLFGDESDMKALLRKVVGAGPKLAVVTDGDRGSYTHDGREFWKCGITGTPVVERTGAGDAFATAFMAAIIRGEKVPGALRWGTMNSGSVISKVGSQAGLLTLPQMRAWLKKFSKLNAQRF